MAQQTSIDFFPSSYEDSVQQQHSTHQHQGYVIPPPSGPQFGVPLQPQPFYPASGVPEGNMDTGMGGYSGEFGDEPPLLEELGIDPHAIRQKAIAVLNPKAQLDETTLHDEDIGGPFIICLVLGGVLLLGGKLHFGYLFGYSVAGSIVIQTLLNLMAEVSIGIYHTMSVLGYSLMPMVVLAVACLFIPANTVARFLIMAFCIAWSTHSASSMFVRVLRTNEQLLLFMYPIALLYTCFALIVMF